MMRPVSVPVFRSGQVWTTIKIIRICNHNRKRVVEHELGSLETKSVTAFILTVLRLIPDPAHSFPIRMSTIELFELVSRTGKPGQTDAIDQIKGTRCPLVVLVLLVGPEDERALRR